mgnify:CR=1 FL=1
MINKKYNEQYQNKTKQDIGIIPYSNENKNFNASLTNNRGGPQVI